jgi:hypothetical protein
MMLDLHREENEGEEVIFITTATEGLVTIAFIHK